MRDSGARGLKHLRDLENIPVRWRWSGPRKSCSTGAWTTTRTRIPKDRGKGEFTGTRGVTRWTLQVLDWECFSALVQQGGTQKPRTYALGAIAPRIAEQQGDPGPNPPGSVLPLTWYVAEKQAEKILDTLGYEIRNLGEA